MNEDQEHVESRNQVETHSLPGTDQVARRPDPCEKDDQESRPGVATQDQLEEHSLPCTNRAGAEPSPGKEPTE